MSEDVSNSQYAAFLAQLHASGIDSLAAEVQAAVAEVNVNLNARLVASNDDAGREALRWATTPWSSNADWKSFTPLAQGAPTPWQLALGRVSYPVVAHDVAAELPPAWEARFRQVIETPAMVPLVGGRNIFIAASPGLLDQANAALQGLLLRAVAAAPPGRVRLLLIDPVGVGNHFSQLTALPEAVRGQMVWHSAATIATQLEEMTAHTGKFIQQFLKDGTADINDFNAKEGVAQEPYRIIGIANFPSGFSDNMWLQLRKLLENGPRAGVTIAMTMDAAPALPRGCELADLARFCDAVCERPEPAEKGGWAWSLGTDHLLRLDTSLSSELAATIGRHIAARVSEGISDDIPFVRFLPPKYFQQTITRAIRVPIGMSGAEPQLFSVQDSTENAHHALIAGRTGSGKSVLLHVLITSLCTQFSPEDVELYLIDLKQGVEFQVYTRLPHARVVAIQAEREFALSVLRGLLAELEKRGADFPACGAHDIHEYRARGQRIPFTFLLVDEFQRLFERSDRIGSESRRILDRLIREGRAFGIHVILASQTLNKEFEPGTMANVAIRIALMMDENESFRILSKDNPAANLLSKPGEAIYNSAAGAVGANRNFQAAMLAAKEHTRLLSEISREAMAQGFDRVPIVFDGRQLASVRANRMLMSPVVVTGRSKPDLFVGEPVGVTTEHVAFRMRRQSQANLLIVGPEEQEALSVVLAAVASLALFSPPESVCIRLLNLIMDERDYFPDLELLAHLPQEVRLGVKKNVAETLESFAAEVERRESGEGSAGSRMELLVFFGIQRARELQRDGFAASKGTKAMQQILERGPDVGVHVIAVADTHQGLMRVIEQRTLSEFGTRIALAGADQVKLFGDQVAPDLKRNYGVMCAVADAGEPEKFRVYGPDIVEWLRERAGAVAPAGE